VSPSKGKRPTKGRGGKGGGSKAPGKRPPGRAETRRLGLLVFGALFVLLFAGFAVAQGIGATTVPSGAVATIKGMPADASAPLEESFKDCKGKTVTQDLGVVANSEYDCAFLQTAAGLQLKKPPKPSDSQYKEVKEKTMEAILGSRWITGLATERGVSVTAKEIQEKLEEIKKQEFKTEANFKKFMKTSHYSSHEIEERIKQLLLTEKIQKELGENPPTPSDREVKEYYEAAVSAGSEETLAATQAIVEAPTRNIRILTAKNQKKAEAAKAMLEKDSSEKGWIKAGKKYAANPASESGSVMEKLAESAFESYDPEYGEALFNAPKGKLEGPVKSAQGYTVFEVVKENPERTRSLKEAEAEIKSALGQQLGQKEIEQFVVSFEGLWGSRTFCASGYEISKCANFRSDAHPAAAEPACYEANPKGGLPEAGCPAPVTQTKPALPGTNTFLKPQGEKANIESHPAQRPHGEGEESTEEEASSIPGLPPGAVPTSP
jgi:parvulin-like peptidyl-prolyl isomerase